MINFWSATCFRKNLRKAGVIFQPLERAMIEHEDLFRRHFMSQPATLGSAKFAALHEAFVRSGTFLYVPRGVEIELPLETFHWLHAENAAIFPHTLVVAEELSKVTLVEHFRSTDRQRAGFACGVNDLIVGRRRESDLHLRARLERQSVEHPNQRHHRRPRCDGAESPPRTRRKIFASRKSQPPYRRRRPQRHARGFDRRRSAGIRRAHFAGSRFAAHQRATCFSKTRSAVAPAIPSAV